MRDSEVVGGGGVRLRVSEAGNPAGRAVLLLHGWSQCRLVWQPLLRSGLARDVRLVAVDLRGHGWSDQPADGYDDPELWAADLHAVITRLDLHRPVLVGWSYAGLAIADYLRVHGDAALGGVHLVAAISQLGTEFAAATVGQEFLAAARRSYRPELAECLGGVQDYLRLVLGPSGSDAEHALRVGYNLRVPPWLRRALFLRRAHNDDVLRALTVPVLIAHGDQDRVVLPAAGAHHTALLPAAHVSRYRGVGHAPFLARRHRFVRELRAFVAACP